MTTFNTGNPIGSTDARDRSDNSENLDLAVNSLSLTFIDRLGVTRDTLEGVYQKSAYYQAGTFDTGYTLTNNRQTLAYGNVEYSWSGAFPKVVPAGSTPATTGGVGAGAWVDRTDIVLRQSIGDVYLSEYCVGDGVTSDTLKFRAAVAACPEGCTVYGDASQTYYLDYQELDGKVVEIKKGIKLDFRGAKVIFKSYSDSNPAAIHAPAIRFTTDSTGVSYTFSGSVNENAFEIDLGQSHSLQAGDWVSISSDQVYYPWNSPNGSLDTFTGISDISQIKSVSGTVIKLDKCLRRTYSGNITVSKRNMLSNVSVSGISNVTEIDSNVISTKNLWSDCGHFIALEKCIAPSVYDIQAYGGWRLMLLWTDSCINANTHHITGKVTNPLYPLNGGHGYLIRHGGSCGALSYSNLGIGVRHVIDYTNSVDCYQEFNTGWSTRAFAFTTHGFYEKNIQSVGDVVFNDSFYAPPASTDFAGGWVLGNDTFRRSHQLKVKDFTYRGYGIPIIMTSLSEDLSLINPDIEYYGSDQLPVRIEGGCSKVKIIGGSIKTMNASNTRPVIFVGSWNRYDFGSATYTASAGVNPTMTFISQNRTPFNVGDSVYMCLKDTANGEYAGLWTVTTFNGDHTYTLKSQDSRTTTTPLSFTDSWDPVGNRRAYFASELVDVSDFEIDGTELYHYGQPNIATVYLGGVSGSVRIAPSRIHAINANADAINLNGVNGKGQCGSVDIENVKHNGDSLFDSFVQVNAYKISSGLSLSGNSVRNFDNYALRIRGSAADIRSNVLSNGLKLSDNDFKSASCSGVTNFNVWTEKSNGYDIRVSGNFYPTTMTDATNGINWERGTLTPTVVTTTGGSASGYTVQSGKYSMNGNVLQFQARVAWSGLTGSNMQINLGKGFPVGGHNIPCTVSSVTLTTLVGVLNPNYSGGGTVNLRQTSTSGVDSWVALAASGDLCLSGTITL